MNDLLIASPSGGALPISPEGLLNALHARWPGHVRVSDPTSGVALTAWVDPAGESPFSISLNDAGTTMWVDGTPEQNRATAVWIRSLLPEPAPRVIAFDSGWTWHVDLVPGITGKTFDAAAVDHSLPGWDERDPELA
ncbi:hypothetical protein CHMI_01401 [Cellulomonas hominis]|nr:hypothetical protein CHMI_01401 [Cellulomonas hominis]